MTDTASKAIALGEWVERLQGNLVRVTEAISWRPGTDFERHSSALVSFDFVVSKTMWQMSGGHYVLYGPNETCFMIGTTKLVEADLTPQKASIIERFGNDAERRSVVQILSS